MKHIELHANEAHPAFTNPGTRGHCRVLAELRHAGAGNSVSWTTSAWRRSIDAHLRFAPTLGRAMGLRPALEASDGFRTPEIQALALLALWAHSTGKVPCAARIREICSRWTRVRSTSRRP